MGVYACQHICINAQTTTIRNDRCRRKYTGCCNMLVGANEKNKCNCGDRKGWNRAGNLGSGPPGKAGKIGGYGRNPDPVDVKLV